MAWEGLQTGGRRQAAGDWNRSGGRSARDENHKGFCVLTPAACRLPPAACRLPPAACRLPPAACSDGPTWTP